LKKAKHSSPTKDNKAGTPVAKKNPPS
jgi:hypothetical protein